jgi:hypothetical protein
MGKKSVTTGTRLVEHLTSLLGVFLEIDKAPAEVREAFYKCFLCVYKSLDRTDQTLVRRGLNILLKEL